MEHLLSTARYFDASWQSVDRIPIVLSLLKEALNRLENAKVTDSLAHFIVLQQKLTAYRTLYKHWSEVNLNPRQMEWLSKMQLYLQALQQRVHSLSPSSRSLSSHYSRKVSVHTRSSSH